MNICLGASRWTCRCLPNKQYLTKSFVTLSSAKISSGTSGSIGRRDINLSYDVHVEENNLALPPVIVCHGLFGNKNNWRQLSRQLNLLTHRTVIAIDAVNHGRSSHHPDMSYNDMAEDLISMLDRLDIPQSILIGHSMGGKMVMTAALSHPDRFDKLVVVDSAPEPSKSMGEIMTYLRAMAGVDLGGITSRKMVEDELKTVVPSKALLEFLLSNLQRSHGRYSWRVNLKAIEDNYHYIHSFPDFSKETVYPHPTLFVGGGRSYYITEAERPNILRFFPRAEIIKIPDAGHWVHSEKPKEFIEAVAPFIVRL